MAEAIFDKQEQLDKISESLLPGEQVLAVFDLKGTGTGFLGITTRRVIIYDKTFMRKMKAVVSVPYAKVLAIGSEDESGLFTGRGFFSSSKIHIITSHAEYSFEFRGADKAHVAHDLILARMVA